MFEVTPYRAKLDEWNYFSVVRWKVHIPHPCQDFPLFYVGGVWGRRVLEKNVKM